MSSFIQHSKIDPEHKADLDRVIDQLDPTPAESAIIGLSAIRSVYYLTQVMRGINNQAPLDAIEAVAGATQKGSASNRTLFAQATTRLAATSPQPSERSSFLTSRELAPHSRRC